MYNPYFNSQQTKDRIDNQILQLQQMKEQLSQQPIPQPTNLTQNFQIAPNNGCCESCSFICCNCNI